MRFPTHAFRIASIVLIELATATALQAATPTTHPAPATQPANPDFTAGQEAARRDAAAGKFSLKLVVPETFILMEMNPNSESFYNRDYYIALLEDRYGIKASTIVVLPGGSAEANFGQGYDQVILPAIEAKFGKGILDKVWRESVKTKKTKQAAYLEKRKAAATQPTTKPAANRTPPIGK